MSWPDLVNGCFELFGGVLVWMNVRQVLRDREVKGVWWPATAGFSLWGWWNMFYYPMLDQWASFAGGCMISSANTVWLALVLYYLYRRPAIHVDLETDFSVDLSPAGFKPFENGEPLETWNGRGVPPPIRRHEFQGGDRRTLPFTYEHRDEV